MAAIKSLLDAGTGSLGGARPKASVRSDEGLLIAKFPHHNDRWDVMGWEKTVLDLAERAGIPAPWRDLVYVGDKRALLLKRLDRTGTSRIGDVLEATAEWREAATHNGIPNSSQARFTDTFEARRPDLSNT